MCVVCVMFAVAEGLSVYVVVFFLFQEAHSRRKGVLRKLESLTTDPGPMEIHTNSNCRRCRADWGKTGPICG